jgi:hypothetical protein
MTGNARWRGPKHLPGATPGWAARRSQSFFMRLVSSLITRVVVLPLIGLVIVLALIAKVESYNPFAPHSTISATVVLGKITMIEQAHVATRTYPVDVRITQSVGVVPCFLICNKMELKGSGTDDAIVDLSKLSQSDVTVNQLAKTVTVRLAAPTIGPASLDTTTCSITSSHGIINGLTQGFRNNPNGYRPLYLDAQSQVHSAAERDKELLAAGEQSTRSMLTRVLGAIGVQRVLVNFS